LAEGPFVWVCWRETVSWADGRFVEAEVIGVYDTAETAMHQRRPKPPKRPSARARAWEQLTNGSWRLQSNPSLHLERRLIRDMDYVQAREKDLGVVDWDYLPTP
ncbi:MAG TPA: hypothetical protein VNL71_19075, partial [Chloroflexota bacterium]|nr:hypothetical protein [Chloroflexota bacterium]